MVRASHFDGCRNRDSSSHHSLHSSLKEFIEPLRTGNPRADFFTVYRKESDVYDREYARKYDEDLNTSLIFVSFTHMLGMGLSNKR